MTIKPNRRDVLFSGAALATLPATAGTFLAGPAFAQAARTRDLSNSTAQIDAYMGAPVELTKAKNGAITNKRLLDGIGKVAWVEPTIETPAEGIWVFGGYGLAPMAIIELVDRDPDAKGAADRARVAEEEAAED